MKIYIMYDCPMENNDKIWLYNLLKQSLTDGEVIAVPAQYVISRINRSGMKGKIKAYVSVVEQSIKVLGYSKKNDIIICWSQTQGIIFNFFSRLIGNSRNIISLNWLFPPKEKYPLLFFLFKYLATNSKSVISVNCKGTIPSWNKYLGVKIEKYLFNPDVYDDSIEFETPTRGDMKYCFAGGMANRDWKLIIEIAKVLKDYRFVCVALQKDFEEKIQMEYVPANVEVYYDVASVEYYKLMRNATVILLPLIEDIPSGLINIIHAAQYGKLCMVTKNSTTEQYFHRANAEFLMSKKYDRWILQIEKIMDMDEDEYVSYADKFQKYIKEEFAPQKAVEKILISAENFILK